MLDFNDCKDNLQEDFKKFLESGDSQFLCSFNFSSVDRIIVRVPRTSKFDFIYIGYTEDFETYPDLSMMGLYDKKNKLFYSTEEFEYICKTRFNNILDMSLSDLTKLMHSTLNTALAKYIEDNKIKCGNIDKVKDLFNKFYTGKYNYQELYSSARSKYINGEYPTLNIEAKDFYSGPSLKQLPQIMEFLTNEDFIDRLVNLTVNSEVSKNIYSSDRDVIGSLSLNFKEYVGFRYLEFCKAMDIYNGFVNGSDKLATKIKNIKEALALKETKTVTVTMKNEDKEVTFKYPTAILNNVYFSTYYVKETALRPVVEGIIRDLKSTAYNNYLSDEQELSLITSITFSGKVLYKDDSNTKYF